MTSFSEIFGVYMDDPSVTAAFQTAVVESCILDSENRTLKICGKATEYIPFKAVFQAKTALVQHLSLASCNLNFTFDSAAFNNIACADLTDEIRLKNAAMNGYFNRAEYRLNGDEVTIHLNYGGLKTIREQDFERQFCALVKERFGREVSVDFEGQLDDVEIELPPLPTVAPPEQRDERPASAPSAEPKKISFEARTDIPENGIVYLDNPQVFYGGRTIDTNTTPMIRISENDTRICCWGEVFDLEKREITTKRGEKRVIINFCFSDHTNALKASIFTTPKRVDELAPLKDGAYILVNATYELDTFKNEFLVKFNRGDSIALLQKYEEMDLHEGEKRVELHCHTNMSAGDAVSSGEDIVNRAYKWGHKAVAITDHGVVQAFPSAAGAAAKIRKNDPDFKVIYGVEAYFVDDTRTNIDGMTPKKTAKYRHHQIILLQNHTRPKHHNQS
ncbi:MAG: PHP domain-containing protein, partial [Clostridia bacterium]|nr:PHP domain-containing protein [Clostridia bacterium]